MTEITLNLDTRTLTGRHARKIRKQGLVPSVVYGGKGDPVSTQSEAIITAKVAQMAGKHTPVHLTIAGKKKLAMIKNVDMDPVKHSVRHVAFHAVKQNEKITAEIPIILVGAGESEAEKAGLVVLQALEKVELKAVPAKLPEALEANIALLQTTDDKITLADLVLPEGTEFAGEQDVELVVANVYEPSALQAANEAAGGTAESEAEVESENGSDTPQDSQAEETKPGGKLQDEPKQSNVDANK